MNETQIYYLLHTAKDEITELRKSAWEVMELQSPETDNVSDEIKLRLAKDSFYVMEQSLKEAKGILDGIILRQEGK